MQGSFEHRKGAVLKYRECEAEKLTRQIALPQGA
jgi:hypothetical protein